MKKEYEDDHCYPDRFVTREYRHAVLVMWPYTQHWKLSCTNHLENAVKVGTMSDFLDRFLKGPSQQVSCHHADGLFLLWIKVIHFSQCFRVYTAHLVRENVAFQARFPRSDPLHRSIKVLHFHSCVLGPSTAYRFRSQA